MEHFELTLILSKVIGITFVVFAAGVALNLNIYTSVVRRIIENPLLLFMVGSVDLILGLLIVMVHNDWSYSWTVLVTIVGWLLVVRGFIRIVFPRVVLAIARKMEGKFRWTLALSAAATFAYGGALLYFAWMVH